MLQSLVDIIRHGLTDENQKVKTITALSIAALAEAASPYGIESFDDVLEPLWKGIRLLRWVPGCLYLKVRMCWHLFAMSSRCCVGSWLPKLLTRLMLEPPSQGQEAGARVPGRLCTIAVCHTTVHGSLL